MTTGGSAVADGDAGWSEQEGALPDALHLSIEGADGASHEIHDALCFLWGDVIQLEQHAMALADGLHSGLGITEPATAQDRDLREPDPERGVHDDILLTHLELFSTSTRVVANP
jgi:hypothetical protein